MKKYNLSRGMLVPAVAFVSTVFVPLILSCMIGMLIDFFNLAMCLVGSGFLAAYVALVIFFRRQSRKDAFVLILHGEHMEITYSDALSTETKSIHLRYAQIGQIEYYRLHSPRAWLQSLTNYALPMRVYVSYVSDADGEEYSAMIGYLRLHEVKQIAKYAGVGLKLC